MPNVAGAFGWSGYWHRTSAGSPGSVSAPSSADRQIPPRRGGGIWRSVLSATARAVPAGFLVGVCQGAALNLLVPLWRRWAMATGFGWVIGIAVGAWLDASVLHLSLVGWIFFAAAAGGLLAGAAQAVVLAPHVPRAGLWIPVSVLAWAIQFPGAVSGVALVRMLRRVR